MANREFLTLFHGMILGFLFLLASAGGLASLYSLRTGFVAASGLKEPNLWIWKDAILSKNIRRSCQ